MSKPKSNKVLIEFSTKKQAEAFYNYFDEYGFDDFRDNDHVRDDLPSKHVPQYVSIAELPGFITTPKENYYYIQIQ